MGFRTPVLLLSLVLCMLDTVSIFCLYVIPSERGQLQKDFYHYEFGKSLFDMLALSVVRTAVIVGAILGLVYNGPGAVKRIRSYSKLVVYFGCVICIYTIIKVLYFTEDSRQRMNAYVWVIFGFTFLSSIVVYGNWRILPFLRTFDQARSILVNVSDKEGFPGEGGNSSRLSDSPASGDLSGAFEEEEEDSEGAMNKFDKQLAKQTSTSQAVWKLLKLTKPDLHLIFFAVLCLITAAAGEVFMPYYSGQVINYIVIERSSEKFKQAMLILTLISLVSGFASGSRGSLFHLIAGRYCIRVQSLLFSRLIRQEIGFFDARKTGEITSRLTSDCTKMSDQIGLNVNIFLRNTLKILGILVFMIKLSFKLSIVTLVAIPVVAIISEAFGQKYRKLSEKVQNSLAKANAAAEEAISSMRTVRTFAAEEDECKRYKSKLSVTYGLIKRECLVILGYRWCTEVADIAITVLILYYGGHLVLIGELSGGHLVSFVLYSFELGFCIEEIGDIYTGLMEAVGASKNVLFYIERKPCIKQDGGRVAERLDGRLEFRDVTFSYPTRPEVPVLKDISFTANPGETVALVGPSGGGKTSVVNLLEHFYEPQRGQVLVDGIPVEDYDHKCIHERISLVQQEPVLFARTIAENIAYGLSRKVDLREIQSCAGSANAHSFIVQMPRGYETEAGEKGVQLSGGQKQRVAIARALIRNPSILILDEATSALDAESEFLVQEAINKNLDGRTVIIIAHRLSTIERANKVLVIDKGKVVQSGTHSELMGVEGVYANLVKRQLLGKVDESADDENLLEEVPLKRSLSQDSHGSYGTSPSKRLPRV